MILFVAIVGALEFALVIFFGIMFIRRSQSVDIFHRLRRHVDTNTKVQETADIVQRDYNFVKQSPNCSVKARRRRLTKTITHAHIRSGIINPANGAIVIFRVIK